MKEEREKIKLDGEYLEVVNEHKYLGTMVSKSGKRTSDIQKRIIGRCEKGG